MLPRSLAVTAADDDNPSISLASTLARLLPTSADMDDWWSEIDNEILMTLAAGGAMAPADIARRLGVSEASVTSLIWALVSQGKIRVRLVEAAA